MFEETIVRSTIQEVFAHRHECSKIRDGIGREVLKLSAQKVQKTPEERMRGKGETTVDVGGEQNALTWLRLWFRFPLRQPHRLVEDHP